MAGTGKKQAVLMMLAMHPDWSNGRVAKACGVSRPLVTRYRREAREQQMGMHNQVIDTLIRLAEGGEWDFEAMASEWDDPQAAAREIMEAVVSLRRYADALEANSVSGG